MVWPVTAREALLSRVAEAERWDKWTNDQPQSKRTIELYALFCLSSRMLSLGFPESLLVSQGCAAGYCANSFGLAEPAYRNMAPVAQSIPTCALCTDDGEPRNYDEGIHPLIGNEKRPSLTVNANC